MTRVLILVFALLVLSGGPVSTAEAGRPTRYARAKMRGRAYTHRPFYKQYKGRKASKKRLSFFHQKARAGNSSYKVGRHSTR
ncbi:hypothetical protein [Hymenobacter metallilatus]|uniref:Uncharacterized protein n=1 Tax=Hymenobacter metallilatus TaxID=2493666 RepID=A0A3R9N3P5_9BACT|nr:hypothetical protein [Hymenobacter metallilatus]RSK24215.1 hypothetical protein EI290_20770 [Hymenobacter metallilatus]